ncbi:MAG TPA: hypothetical protein PK812_10045 [Beijerinckiaceae bacterium]|nr:hypothetical protein [Beijerinckiaceae bacterium]
MRQSRRAGRRRYPLGILAAVTPSKRRDLLRVLEDLRRSERFIRSAISDLEQLLNPEASVPGRQPMASGVTFEAGFSEVAADYEADESMVRPPSAQGGSFAKWSMSDAIQHVLEAAKGSLTNAEILAALTAGNFHFKTMQPAVAVAQCLKRLQDLGIVRRPERGQWLLAERTAS